MSKPPIYQDAYKYCARAVGDFPAANLATQHHVWAVTDAHGSRWLAATNGHLMAASRTADDIGDGVCVGPYLHPVAPPPNCTPLGLGSIIPSAWPEVDEELTKAWNLAVHQLAWFFRPPKRKIKPKPNAVVEFIHDGKAWRWYIGETPEHACEGIHVIISVDAGYLAGIGPAQAICHRAIPEPGGWICPTSGVHVWTGDWQVTTVMPRRPYWTRGIQRPEPEPTP